MPPRTRFHSPFSHLRQPTSCAILPRQTWSFHFHTSRQLRDGSSDFPNHYEALELLSNASAADIKRQFYSLSKRHHPDLARSHVSNPPSDEAKSSPSRFHQINEAYHVLGSADSRQRYDRDYNRHFGSHQRHPPSHPQGSFSSHSSSSYAGSRPASGLSRRRTQFRGPPPSFYQQGMYGNTDSTQRRRSNADGEAARAQTSGSPGSGGVFEQEVPHFDRNAHKRTQEGVASTMSRSRASRRGGLTHDQIFAAQGGDLLPQFILMSGLLAFIIGVPLYLLRDQHKRKEDAKH